MMMMMMQMKYRYMECDETCRKSGSLSFQNAGSSSSSRTLGSLRMKQITMLLVYLQLHYGNLVGMARNDPAVGMGWLAFSMNERIR